VNKSPQSFCYFIATSWNNQAVPQHFQALAQELVHRGHRVVIFVDGNRKDVENHYTNPAVYTWPSRRPTRWRDFWFLSKMICKFTPNCLIANFGSVNIMMISGWITRIGVRIAWYRTPVSALNYDNTLIKQNAHWMRFRKKIIYTLTTTMVANSVSNAHDLKYRYKVKKIKVMHNSLLDPCVSLDISLADKGEAKAESTQINILVPGRLFPTKGQRVLIDAMKLLSVIKSSIFIEIIGDGPCKQDLQQLVKAYGLGSQVCFTSSVSHDIMLHRMAEADIVVVPSLSEAFGLVNVEALAVGTPVVASRIGGIPEIIRDGVDGLLFEPGNAHDLADKLAVLISDPELRARMGKNGRERFLSTFEQRVVIKDQADWFEQLVRDR
jgi:glycosyltransferase involved in cell wall biosynthesis